MSHFEGIRMSFKESYQVDVCHQVIRGELPAKVAALKLEKSYRQTLRIIDKVRSKGIVGIKHGNFGKVPVNKSDPQFKEKILKLYLAEYFDFNMTHFLEFLIKDHGIKIAHENFRLWAHEINHVKRSIVSVRKLIRCEPGYHGWE